ncbi:MAG TPA: DNA-processing protein DprA [Candidatus Krumholzibacteria bacterium]|nr:DNA-processing protein DprA [Candidatus Krumholzibacteria bacterium]
MEVNHIALALSMTRNVVPGDWLRLEGTPSEIWDLLQGNAGLAALGAALGHDVGPVNWGAFDDQLARAEKCGARVVSRWDADYPWRLRHVAAPPPILFVRGCVDCLQRESLAIVGTRAPSAAGMEFAARLARAVAAQDVVVVSGLARGIDTAAHRGALEAARGGTVAVLGTGVDVVYPAENAALFARVVERGAVVSEQWCGMIGAPHVFPRRNRIISGLSEGVVVVEGGVKSGALITARWALEQGREVGAVPGFPGDFRSAGPNYLIKQGAFVVEDAVDVFANVAGLGVGWVNAGAPRASARETDTLDTEARRVYDLVSHDVDADHVARASGLEVGRVQEILARLEIDGYLVRGESGRFARTGR